MPPQTTVIFSLHIGSEVKNLLTGIDSKMASRRSATAQKQLQANAAWRTKQGQKTQGPKTEIVMLDASSLGLIRKPKQSLPPQSSFDQIATWISSCPQGHLPPLLPPVPKQNDLEELVNLYAAAQLFSLLPVPRKLQAALIRRIHALPSLKAEQIRLVWVRLPGQQKVLDAVVEAYYRHLRWGKIGREDDEAIWALTDAEPELDRLFVR